MRSLFILLLLVSVAKMAVAQLPSASMKPVYQYVPNATLVGSAQFTYFFMDVYKAYLFSSQKPFKPVCPYALVLQYQRDLSGSSIAEKSIDLMAVQKPKVDESHLIQWHRDLDSIFPNVKAGSIITGVCTKEGGAVFYNQNGKRLGKVKSPEFSRYFFNIWLGKQTEYPRFRYQLLNLDY